MWIGLILGTGFLMVSSWRFWSGKEISTGGRHPFQLVVVLVLVVGLLLLYSEWFADPAGVGISGFGGDGAAGVLVEQGAPSRA